MIPNNAINLFRNFLTAIAACAVSLVTATAHANILHPMKRVFAVRFDSRQCVFFSLQGVAEADPITPGPNFTILKTHHNYNEFVAILLSAHATDLPIDVETDGQTACGHASVTAIVLRRP